MSLEFEIKKELTNRGATFVHFVDVSHLPKQQNQGLNTAILLGLPLSPEFIREVSETEDYVEQLICNNRQDEDEFSLKELEAGRMADELTNLLQSKNYLAFSQSDKNLESNGCYDFQNHATVLPHKTIAVLAGMGWIGKNNLLITNELGSALSMCSVLTNAPLSTSFNAEIHPKCGNCTICKDVCAVGAIKGINWGKSIARDERIDVYQCTTCLKCLVHCPWTQRYANKLKKMNIRLLT